MELAWNRLETNEFGTNEFVRFVRKVKAEPFFAVNMGTGTMVEARRWVEYTNVDAGPYYAELRKEHGYPEPHNIKYWSLGNEMDGGWQMGHLNADDYTKKARETAKLMKMSYKAVWSKIKATEKHLNTRIVHTDRKEGSRLTKEGKELLQKYKCLKEECMSVDDKIFSRFFD